MKRRELLALGGLTALLAACGDDGSAAGAQLQFMYWGSTFEQKAVEKMLKAFEQANAGTKVKPLFTPDEYDVKLNTLVASGNVPDVGYIPMAMSYRLAEQGKLVNLFPYLSKYPQLKGYLPDAYLWYGKDRLHGVATANEIELLWYSRSAIAAAGISPPPATAAAAWTWDQLVENAYKLTIDQNGKHPDESGFDPKKVRQFGVSSSITYAAAWYGFLRSNGADFADAAGTRCLLDAPEAIEVFQNLQDLIYKHRVAPGPGQLAATGDDVPGTNILLKTKRVAMVVDGHWSLLDMNESKADYGIGVLPKYDTPYTTSQVAGASAVFAGSKHVEEAIELFAFHIDPAHVDLYRLGLWMPQERKYYEDQAAIDSWTKNDAHPPEFRTAVVDYARDHGVPDLRGRLKNLSAINSDVLTPALQAIETGKRTAAEVLKEIAPKVTSRMQGWQPTQGL
ncbi:multiple sugar transport system substrate-binding protein [Allocatelliglobosispora scoriae]|uniref:Multiple sugar transport system substrate-binding protein n=1 Tax=Allocatelliglobosispora scoriae TaxID=643052 RepID=A0A841BDX9_9ACTN|nr:extracellular solute-binding protein [Allocatelliglobosispora scoriae]MBB5867307.1 multiple sugar transport system substrate-binding protein [Allocatelliglobosispora scoriae]